MPFSIPWSLVAKVAVVAGVCVGVYLGYRYVDNLRVELEQAKIDISTARNSLAGEAQAVQDLRGELSRVNLRHEEFSAKLADLGRSAATNQEAVATLSRTFARHNLKVLANEKPELIERRINDGTAAAMRLRIEAGTIDRPPH